MLDPRNLKNWEFDKEAPQNSHLERATIVRAQGASEGENFEEKPTQSKPNSSSSLGIGVKKFKVVTLGCRTNQYESQAYVDQMRALGCIPAQEGEEADLCI